MVDQLITYPIIHLDTSFHISHEIISAILHVNDVQNYTKHLGNLHIDNIHLNTSKGGKIIQIIWMFKLCQFFLQVLSVWVTLPTERSVNYSADWHRQRETDSGISMNTKKLVLYIVKSIATIVLLYDLWWVIVKWTRICMGFI